MRKLTPEGKIVIFKTISISKIVFQAFMTTVPKHVVNELKKIQNAFFGIILVLRYNMKLFVTTIKLEG